MNMIPDAAARARRGHADLIAPLGIAAVLALLLFAVAAATVMVFGLRSDVAALEDQARTSAKSARALRDELAALKADLAKAQPAPAAAGSGAATPAAAAMAAAPGEPSAAAHPVKVHAVAARPACVFLAGDPYGLADCIRRQAGTQRAGYR
ncbi:MAG: hypothetical protein PHY45_03715 [Rhodocyclaceae bacterium]|nr:hypothetical protein [Rhodocyclaceae bacterium]